MASELNILLRKIEEKLEWGDSAAWQGRDFDMLNERILDETGVSLSASTLRRVWGKVAYQHLPSTTTLDTLSKFAGYASWRAFQRSLIVEVAGVKTEPELSTPTVSNKAYGTKLWWAAIVIIVAGLLSWAGIKKLAKPDEPAVYRFSSKAVVRDIPNSVIFQYDASSAVSDSVFIQQSWDEQTRSVVDKNQHTFTSIYYEPGFYQAKLLVGRKVVQEHPVLVASNGWLGLINNKPVPVYLAASEFLQKDKLQLAVSDIIHKDMTMQPKPPVVKYYNVGNFTPVPLSNFHYSTKVKHEYKEGAAACQRSYVLLITDKSPIAIPLSAKGCVSELFLRGPEDKVSGKHADLSGFGVDFRDWVQVSCKSDGGKLLFLINDKPAYSLPLPQKPVHIVGLGYVFFGTGAVKGVRLSTHDKLVFEAF